MQRAIIGGGSESESIHRSAGLGPAPVAPEPQSQVSLRGPGQENPYADTISAWVTHPDPLATPPPCSVPSDVTGTHGCLCHSHTPHGPSFLLPDSPRIEEANQHEEGEPAQLLCLPGVGGGGSVGSNHTSPPSPQLLLLQERAEDTDSKYRPVPHPPAWLILALLWDPLTALFPFSGCAGRNSSAYSKAG